MLALSAPAMLAGASSHPQLLFDQAELIEMKGGLDSVPLFKVSIDDIIASADKALTVPIEVPVPCDGGGGVVHERHKSNYYDMMDCGIAYMFTGDEKYARHAADMLEAYATLYPTLGYHQLGMSPVPGRLFWQTLNESVWLVHTAIAYDCIRDSLSPQQRENIETNLLWPMAQFIMEGTEDNRANLKTFNKMHNHGTWATAAVGMAGLATDRKDLVDKALYGTDLTGENGGFLQQMEELFSPDGYFTEGAYYLRYAIWPFVIFANCLEHSHPELKVFERRDGILKKALDNLYQCSYEGEFMHFNDALEKGLSAQELTYAVNILYNAEPENDALPFIARNYQDRFIPCIGGYRLAKAIGDGAGSKPAFRNVLLHDGRDGTEGGIGIIRNTANGENTALTMKATGHGLSHGHYDKLTMGFYDNGKEILSDYGASRFINLEAKNSGHYTRENDTFCKQSVAHNTLVADRTTHFNGKYKESSKHHSDFVDFYQSPDGKIKAMAARDTNAYADKGIDFERTLVMAEIPGLSFPITLDLMKVNADSNHNYDMPYWFRGHMVSTNVPRKRSLDTMSAMGDKNGYQHIWQDAVCEPLDSGMLQYTFFNGNRMYSLSTASTAPVTGSLVRLGANDPDFNLRDEKGWIVTAPEASDCLFATVIEPHGFYDVVWETAEGTKSSVNDVKIVTDTPEITEVQVNYGPENSTVTFRIDKNAPIEDKYQIIL